MPHVRLTTRIEREAVRSVKRACYAGLDSVTLRAEVARRSAVALPTAATSLVVTDPDSGLFVHAWLSGIPDSFVARYLEELYPREAGEYLELARSGRTTTTRNSAAFIELMRSAGLSHRARTALCCAGEMWGSWCIFRDASSPGFLEKEMHLLRVLAPHVASGLRTAALLDAAREIAPDSRPGPGVVVLDARRRVTMRAGPVAEHLRDLASVGARPDLLPYAVVGLLTLLAAPVDGESATGAELRAQGRSGTWYVLRASTSEPDMLGDCSTVIVVEPGVPPVRRRTLTDLYRLTRREREVLRLVVAGESTKRIGTALSLSPYTVQDHVSSACAKVGVRGRRQLVAKLFADGHSESGASPAPPDPLREGVALPRAEP